MLPEKRMKTPSERPNRYFTFLRRLRADGRSNMYGAIPYLAAAFGLDRAEAFRIVCEWVDAHAADSALARAGMAEAHGGARPAATEPVEIARSSSSRAPVAREGSGVGPKSRKPVKQKAARKRPGGKSGRASTPRAA
jgi:hypothetical protein